MILSGLLIVATPYAILRIVFCVLFCVPQFFHLYFSPLIKRPFQKMRRHAHKHSFTHTLIHEHAFTDTHCWPRIPSFSLCPSHTHTHAQSNYYTEEPIGADAEAQDLINVEDVTNRYDDEQIWMRDEWIWMRDVKTNGYEWATSSEEPRPIDVEDMTNRYGWANNRYECATSRRTDMNEPRNQRSHALSTLGDMTNRYGWATNKCERATSQRIGMKEPRHQRSHALPTCKTWRIDTNRYGDISVCRIDMAFRRARHDE